MSRKTIWLNPPLENLLKQTSAEGNFSRKLGDVVERYNLLISIASDKLPVLSAIDWLILKSIFEKNIVVTQQFVESIPEYIDSIEVGTVADRDALKNKIASLSLFSRIALIEKYEKEVLSNGRTKA